MRVKLLLVVIFTQVADLPFARVMHPEGIGVSLRSQPALVDGTEYSLGTRVCVLGSGSRVSVLDSAAVANGEMWFEVAVGESVPSGSTCQLGARGWMAGRLPTMDLLQFDEAERQEAVPGRFGHLWKSLLTLLGCGLGLVLVELKRTPNSAREQRRRLRLTIEFALFGGTGILLGLALEGARASYSNVVLDSVVQLTSFPLGYFAIGVLSAVVGALVLLPLESAPHDADGEGSGGPRKEETPIGDSSTTLN